MPDNHDEQSEAYLTEAAKSLGLAQATREQGTKLYLLCLAQGWLALAKQHDRSRDTPTVADEMPSPKKGPADGG